MAEKMKLRDIIRRYLGLDGIDAQCDAIRFQVDELIERIPKRVTLDDRRSDPRDESVFGKHSDKIQPSGTTRYVPVARRRAAAEMASHGPQTHTEQVRANNQKALETT